MWMTVITDMVHYMGQFDVKMCINFSSISIRFISRSMNCPTIGCAKIFQLLGVLVYFDSGRILSAHSFRC